MSTRFYYGQKDYIVQLNAMDDIATASAGSAAAEAAAAEASAVAAAASAASVNGNQALTYADYAVATGTYVTITLPNATTTMTYGRAYRVELTTLGTGTVTGAVYIATPSGSGIWSLINVSNNGISSNHPQLRIALAGDKLEVFHTHGSTYTIRAAVKSINTGSPYTAPTFYGVEGIFSMTNGIAAINGSQIWTAANLNAPSVTATGNSLAQRDASGYLQGSFLNMSDDGLGTGTAAVTAMITKRGDNYYRSTPASYVKTFLALSNVDNTSDANKPVSTAQAAADALKLSLTGGILTGNLDVTTSAFHQIKQSSTSGSQALWSGSVADSIGAFIGSNARYQTSYQYMPNYTAASVIRFGSNGVMELCADTGLTSGVTYVPTPRLTVSPTGTVTAVTFSGALTGNASTATKLITARTINGVAFDGTANITVADATKEPSLAAGTTAQYYRGDKTWQTLDKTAVGLASVDNTSDASKPVSTAQATAIGLKFDKAGGALTGTLTTRATTSVAAITSINGTSVPIYAAQVVVPVGSPSYTEMMHGETILSATGYRQHISIGAYRPGAAAWGGAIFMGIGGSDSNVTEGFYLNYGGTITHSNGATFLSSNNYNTYSPTLTGTGATGTWPIDIGGNALKVSITTDEAYATPTYVTFNRGGGQAVQYNSSKLSFIPSSGQLTAVTFVGAGTGLTGTAAGLSVGGNAATATKLITPRLINGVAFDGTADISTGAGTATNVPWSGVTSKPTTIAGYGITDAVGRGEYKHFGVRTYNGANGTTATFLAWLNTLGFFAQSHSVLKFSWDYAGNIDLTDTGFGAVEVAGAVLEGWIAEGTGGVYGNIHLRLICPNAGGAAFQEFVYNDQGSTYAPGWRKVWTSASLTNLNQLTNGPGYITGLSFAGLTGKPTTTAGYGITDFFSGNSAAALVSGGNNMTVNSLGYVTGMAILGQTDGGLYGAAYDTTSWQHQIYGDFRTGQIATRGRNNGVWQAWRTQWDSTNLNPQESAISGSVVKRDASGYLFGNYCNFTDEGTNGSAGTVTGIITKRGDNYYRNTDAASVRTYLGVPTNAGTGASGTWPVSVTGSAATSPFLSSSGNYVHASATLPQNYPTGMSCSFVGAGAGEGSFPHYGGLITFKPYTGGGGGCMQMLSGYGASYGNADLKIRIADNGSNTFGAWKIVMDENNLGTHMAARTAGNVTSVSSAVGSAYSWTGVQYFVSNKGASSYIGANSSYVLQAHSTDAGAAAMSFHRAGSYAVNLGLDPDNVFRLGGWSAQANVMAIDMSGNFTVLGNVTAYSDERLKTNWRDVQPTFLEEWSRIKHGVYDRIDTGEEQAGLSAQDAQKVLPQIVGADKDGILHLNYGAGAAIASIELAKEVLELRAELRKQAAIIKLLMEKVGY